MNATAPRPALIAASICRPTDADGSRPACQASAVTHGRITASGPTKPTGPLQRTARPPRAPIRAARPAGSRGGRVFWGPVELEPVELGPRRDSAARTVIQVVRAVRIASGVAAWDSIPTRRHPIQASAATTPVRGENQTVPARSRASAVARAARAEGIRAGISETPNSR